MIGLLVIGAVGLAGFQDAVVQCVSSHAVELARKSKEPAETLVAAANAECSGTWDQARMIGQWSTAPMPTDSPAFRDYVMGEAARAVIEARAKP